MSKGIRTVVYDAALKIEAYRFKGIMQSFPNHFHEHYVIGLIEGGERLLSCKNQEYILNRGDIVLFNPGDNHACFQRKDGSLNYRAFNISKSTMQHLVEEVTGSKYLPRFHKNVIFHDEIASYLHSLHKIIMKDSHEFEKEETLLFLISLLLQNYGQPFEQSVPQCSEEIEKICRFMEQNFSDTISLDHICKYSGLSKSTLLRAFTKTKGVTPYRYLEAIRINKAKELLENGISPIETAMRTGFSDQSHFTKYFNCFIGLAPGVYRDIFFDKKESEGKNYGE